MTVNSPNPDGVGSAPRFFTDAQGNECRPSERIKRQIESGQNLKLAEIEIALAVNGISDIADELAAEAAALRVLFHDTRAERKRLEKIGGART